MTNRISVKKTGEELDKTFPLHMVGALLNVRYGVALCGLIIGLIPRPVSADEIFVPPWRFSPMSTYQTWTFPNAMQRAPDRMFNNARGPTGFETPKFEAGGGWEATALGRDGVWALGDGDSISFFIPNFEDLASKEIWFQFTWHDTLPKVSLGTSRAGINQTLLGRNDIRLVDGWGYTLIGWSLDECPELEEIRITAQNILFIDQVSVDTLCTPEPSMVAQFAVGIAGLLWLRLRTSKGASSLTSKWSRARVNIDYHIAGEVTLICQRFLSVLDHEGLYRAFRRC
jgi:hypothetical protein